MSSKESTKAVIIALVGNFSISCLKLLVSLFTNSAGMLAESIHSFADTLNQILLLVGSKQSNKKTDEQHSFGHGKNEYFFGILVAVLLFFMGGLYSVYEGIHKIQHPESIEHVYWVFIVLFISIIIEYKSFSVAFNQFKLNKNKSTSWLGHLKNSTDTNIIVIIIEDFAALTGLVLVLITTIFAITINPIFDAIGSILVGTLLISTSYILCNELRVLMIGESISRDKKNDIKSIINKFQSVKHINSFRSMYIGNNKFMLVISIDIDDDIHVYQLKHIISEMKSDIRNKYEEATIINIESV